jgi:hypothetical protein
VWSTIIFVNIPINEAPNALTGEPKGPGFGIVGGYNFTYTISPGEIITDTDIPNFKGTNSTPPPGERHPFNGGFLSGGANKKWDGSRQIRLKTLNPNNINVNDTAFSDYGQPPDVLNYPTIDAEGNDDTTTGNIQVPEETNDPYSNNGTLTGTDSPIFALAHRGGVNGNTYELRFQFREFTRLEIEGTWYRISNFYPWRIHFKFLKLMEFG